MNLIETKPVGDANFYKFSVDFTGDDFILGGKTLPLGIVTHDVLNIPADRMLSVFKTGDKLNDLYNRLNAENYSDELFISIRETVEKILNLIEKIKPFRCHRKLQKIQKRILALTAFYVIFLFSAIR